MAELIIKKVEALPAVLDPGCIYYVKEGDKVIQYITDKTGTQTFEVSEKNEPLHPLINFV